MTGALFGLVFRARNAHALCAWMELFQVFDPAFAARNLTEEWLKALANNRAFKVHQLNAQTKVELPAYLAACQSFKVVEDDVEQYTSEILGFWANNQSKFPTWALAARMVFALTPNSAACERVFSLLANFFGDQQEHTLADEICGALMLAYNKRSVG